ncbi:hypothetical protein [Shewanella holmiensis]|uniref:Uncharacterized protein n=1 Tax=Shewanella holmiensis TaxID=2952222 RepID=A0A9X3AP99_9GAMM|nr:hypothetical protein [Shewanella holmiensis]MCT7942377.1 hypothetical protein [Shewanella holmiensis]
MIKSMLTKVINLEPRYLGLISVDMDLDAERIIIMDRISGSILNNTLRPQSGISKTIVSKNYTTLNNIIVGIVDDNMTYNCKFIDGIQAELVDANTVDISQ